MPTLKDSILELLNINDSESIVDAINQVDAKAVNAADDIENHIEDDTAHISSAERSNWNSKASGVHTHSYNDLTDKPAVVTPITLNNTVTSSSTTEAATARAVKEAYDLAASKATTDVATTTVNGLMAYQDKVKIAALEAEIAALKAEAGFELKKVGTFYDPGYLSSNSSKGQWVTAMDDEYIYMTSSVATIRKIRKSTMALVATSTWSFPSSNSMAPSFIYVDDNALFVFGGSQNDKRMHRINKSTLQNEGSVNLSEIIRHCVKIGNYLFCAANSGNIYRIDTTNYTVINNSLNGNIVKIFTSMNKLYVQYYYSTTWTMITEVNQEDLRIAEVITDDAMIGYIIGGEGKDYFSIYINSGTSIDQSKKIDIQAKTIVSMATAANASDGTISNSMLYLGNNKFAAIRIRQNALNIIDMTTMNIVGQSRPISTDTSANSSTMAIVTSGAKSTDSHIYIQNGTMGELSKYRNPWA